MLLKKLQERGLKSRGWREIGLYNRFVDPGDYPFTFNHEACASCRGTCCRWGGYVWITEEEMIAIAGSLGLELGVFADTYVRAAYGRLSLQDRLIDGDQACCMFDPSGNRCAIYSQRPSQCRTFPFWKGYRERYQELLDTCPGVALKRPGI